jgi:hypothetical protein
MDRRRHHAAAPAPGSARVIAGVLRAPESG